MKRYVISGGPGVGKTTIIKILADRGFAIVPEAARLVIEEESTKQDGVLPWNNLALFQEKVINRQLELENKMREEVVFLDRGLVDSYGYCLNGDIPIPGAIIENAYSRYDQIFLAEPLPLYRKDEARLEDFEESQKIHSFIEKAYWHFGYEPIKVSVSLPEERVRFILEHTQLI